MTVTAPLSNAVPRPARSETLLIRPWADEVIDALGFDPRSNYVEKYWLGVLGPSTTWLLRRLAADLEASPAGFELDLAETAHRLGLGARLGRDAPFVRALTRCVQFGMARHEGHDALGVRRKLPPLNRRQLMRLPPVLQAEHERWQDVERVRPEVRGCAHSRWSRHQLLQPEGHPRDRHLRNPVRSSWARISKPPNVSCCAGASTPRWRARPRRGHGTATGPPWRPPNRSGPGERVRR